MMTNPIAANSSNKPTKLFLAFVIASSCIAILVNLNIVEIGSLAEDIVKGNLGARPYVACYDDVLLKASSDEFYEFSSNFGSNSLASLRIQFVDGKLISLPDLSRGDVLKYFSSAEKSILEIDGIEVEYYRIGFDSISFVDSKAVGVRFSKRADLSFDFGDGLFVKLPVDPKRLLRLLGPPKAWEKVKGGPP